MIELPFPDKKYNVIYADPPWQYRDKMHQINYNFGADNHYITQPNDFLRQLPVKDICLPDCALFLWVTSPFLPVGIEVINSWGFKYKTVAFCWVKKTKNGKTYRNLGKWTMGSVEICLVASKGKINSLRKGKNVYQLIEEERTKHSRKPDEARDRIFNLFGDIPRIELFARERINGWDSWGDELTKEITK